MRDDVFKWVWGVLADDDTREIGKESVEKIAARIRTLEAELAQAKADRDVLAKEVNARRLELEWRAHEGDLDRDDVWRWMEEAEAATDASGALSRAGGK